MTTAVAAFDRQRQAPDGFIVVAVLWMLAGLSALVSVYAAYVVQTAAGFAIHEDQLRARALTSAAIELTAFQQLSAAAQQRPTSGWFDFRLGAATVAVEFRSEAARIDLNFAPKPLLAGLFAVLGAPPDAAATYADRVIGWRTPASPGNDREALIYQRAGYQPRGGKFPHVHELALVRGIPAPFIERALAHMTVYSGRAQINVFDAAPEVISALPGISREQVNAVLAARGASLEVRKRALAELGPAQQFATADGSKAIRSVIQISLDNGFRTKSEAVILVDPGQEPFLVLSRRDGLDGVVW
jgi:general secretion pathway protein K